MAGSSLSAHLRKDQRERWSRGQRVLVESYLERFPALSSDPQALLDLVLGEYWLRLEHGESPSVDEYSQRFPELRAKLSEALDEAPQETSTRPTLDTDRPVSTKALACPYCEAEFERPDDVDDVRLRCTRQIHVLDETQSMLVKPGRTFGTFELIRRVGGGEFGAVWLAWDTSLRREVAIKLPRRMEASAREAELFLREGRAAARLRHKNIVPVYEARCDDGLAYIVSAFVHGTNLRESLNHRSYLPNEAAELCRTLAEALAHAHESGIIHRDLKPSNILIDEEGTPYIADFGLAKHDSADEITVTVQGQILGTVAYMPPEQARGRSDLSGPASDVYSLGVILYELLAGRRPFDGPLELLLHRTLTEEPEPPRKRNPDVPRDLETICLKCLAKSPTDRYATAQDLADDLSRFLAGEPITARRASLVERGWRRVKRQLPALAAVAAACFAIGLAIALWSRGTSVGATPSEQSKVFVPPELAADQERPDPAFRHKVSIMTDPEDAAVVCYPLDWTTGRPEFESRIEVMARTPVDVELASGMYLVVAYVDGAFHEVYRTVPRRENTQIGAFPHESVTWGSENGTLRWPMIDLFPETLRAETFKYIEGTDAFDLDLTPGSGGNHRYRVPPFELELTETSVGKFQRLTSLRYVGRAPNLTAGNLSWGQAAAYAESRGLRLPDLVELEYAAMAAGKQKHPWGDASPPASNWGYGRLVDGPTHDRLLSDPRMTCLHSRLLEWTTTRTPLGYGTDGTGLRYLLRGPQITIDQPKLVTQGGPWVSVNEYVTNPAIGLRCARSPAPRLEAEHFVSPLP